MRSEEWFRSETEKILTPMPPESYVQYYIDNDLLPPTNLPLAESVKRRKENKGRLYKKSQVTWSKEDPYKVCPECKESLHITNYHIRGKRTERHGYLAIVSMCMKCQSSKYEKGGPPVKKKYIGNAEIRARKLKKVMMEYLGGKCSDCGFKGQSCQFDFDHLNPKEKEYNLGGTKAAHMDIDDIIKELNKCQLLCALCHRKHSVRREVQDFDPDEEYEEGTILHKMASPVEDREYLRADSV